MLRRIWRVHILPSQLTDIWVKRPQRFNPCLDLVVLVLTGSPNAFSGFSVSRLGPLRRTKGVREDPPRASFWPLPQSLALLGLLLHHSSRCLHRHLAFSPCLSPVLFRQRILTSCLPLKWRGCSPEFCSQLFSHHITPVALLVSKWDLLRVRPTCGIHDSYFQCAMCDVSTSHRRVVSRLELCLSKYIEHAPQDTFIYKQYKCSVVYVLGKLFCF